MLLEDLRTGVWDEYDSVLTASQLVKVQLDLKEQEHLDDVKIPMAASFDDQYNPNIVKTEIKSELIDDDYASNGDYDEEQALLVKERKRNHLAYIRSEEYLPSF